MSDEAHNKFATHVNKQSSTTDSAIYSNIIQEPVPKTSDIIANPKRTSAFPLSGIFHLAADKIGSLVSSPKNEPSKQTMFARKGSKAQTIAVNDDDEFDIVQLEWTDSDKDESSDFKSKLSDNSDAKNPDYATRQQDKEQRRSHLLASAMHAVVDIRTHNPMLERRLPDSKPTEPARKVFKNDPFKKNLSHEDLVKSGNEQTAQEPASWTVERLQQMIVEHSIDGSVTQKTTSRLLKPVVYETLFVFVATAGLGASGMALAEKWSFVLTKHNKAK